MEHRDIIERLGGIRPLARKLDTYPTKVQGWKERNSIPVKFLAAVLRLAKQERIGIKAEDLLK